MGIVLRARLVLGIVVVLATTIILTSVFAHYFWDPALLQCVPKEMINDSWINMVFMRIRIYIYIYVYIYIYIFIHIYAHIFRRNVLKDASPLQSLK